MFIQSSINVDATSGRCIGVDTALFQHCVPAVLCHYFQRSFINLQTCRYNVYEDLNHISSRNLFSLGRVRIETKIGFDYHQLAHRRGAMSVQSVRSSVVDLI